MALPPSEIKISGKKVVTLPVSKSHAEKTVGPVANVEKEVEETALDMATTGALVVDDGQTDFEHMLRKFIGNCDIVKGKNGMVYLRWDDMGNPHHAKVGSSFANLYLRRHAFKQGVTLRAKDLKEVNDMICAYSDMELESADVYLRVAPFEDGIEIDLGDDRQSRVRITPGSVKLVEAGSGTA
jgi:hypothetical protein